MKLFHRKKSSAGIGVEPHEVTLRGGPNDGRRMTITTKELDVLTEVPGGFEKGAYVVTDDPTVLTYERTG